MLGLALLSGCASLTKEPVKTLTEPEKEQRWQAIQAQLSTLDRWQLSGRLGLKIPGQSGSLSIDWTQELKAYTLLLDGPFGQSVAQVQGDSQGVVAKVAGEKEPVFGPTPEYLMMRITGWDLPVSYLRYWVVGLPVPDLQAKVSLDDYGQAKSLQQQGWDVSYLSYRRAADGIRLPNRIKVSRDNIRLTFVISHWDIKQS